MLHDAASEIEGGKHRFALSSILARSANMSVSETKSSRDAKSEASSPTHESDLETGHVAVVDKPSKDGDEALHFLKNQHDVGALTDEEEKKLVRKIDWMIMPLMWGCYCLQYLDKTLGTTFPFFQNISY